MRQGLSHVVCLVAAALAVTGAPAAELGTIRVGVLQFGTVNWELDVIEHHELDAKEGFNLEIHGFGNNDAADVALMGGAVDGIVEDWLWVSRQRSAGAALTFIPYSSSVGAVMVAAGSGIEDPGDLEGKSIGVAGGPLDKGWILIQGLARDRYDIDLASQAKPVYGAPPLLTEKLRSGELDAVLNYWHFCARLEAEGYERLIGVADAQEALGVPADTPQLGYIFHEDWANRHGELVEAFAEASRNAKQIMLESDEEWRRLRPLTRAEDDVTLDALKERYRDGVVRSWGDEERQAAADLYAILAQLGGERLVGNSPTLAEGTFWAGVTY